jgi:hypothetical protein
MISEPGSGVVVPAIILASSTYVTQPGEQPKTEKPDNIFEVSTSLVRSTKFQTPGVVKNTNSWSELSV